MDARTRNDVVVRGFDGTSTLLLAHEFGCDRNLRRFTGPVPEGNRPGRVAAIAGAVT